MSRRVLVVDDEKGIREALTQLLEYEDIDVRACVSGAEALSLYPEFRPHLVLLDVKMQGMDGLETLRKLRELDSRAQVVMISGHGTIQTAVEATQLGAYDFLEKPLDTDRILLTLRNALEHVDLASENVRLKAEVHAQYEIVGSSRAVKGVIERIEKVAPTAARVLITGENGTGKELVARAIHTLSPRGDQPFVEVNCAAIPTELIESELFGHMKGSFTGAFADRAGKFELADGGTLFLDEVGDMSLSAQAKVLRALEEAVISRVGSGKTLAVDVRVVAATNKDLRAEIAAGRFRGSALPAQRRADRGAAAARPPGRRAAAGRALHRSLDRARRAPGQGRRPRRPETARRVRLARQHPRAAQCRRAPPHSRPRSDGHRIGCGADRGRGDGGRGTGDGARRRVRGAVDAGGDVRGVQAGGGADLHPRQAAGKRLECVGDGAHIGYAAQ